MDKHASEEQGAWHGTRPHTIGDVVIRSEEEAHVHVHYHWHGSGSSGTEQQVHVVAHRSCYYCTHGGCRQVLCGNLHMS